MLRLRFLRILLPALLLPFLLLIVFTFRQRPAVLSQGSGESGRGPRAENVELTELWNASKRLFLRARIGEMGNDGRLRLQGVERVEVDREFGAPLVLRADSGGVEGKAGQRVLSLEGDVEVRDEPAALVLSLPGIEVQEATSEARSLGTVRFRGPGYHGTAAAVRSGLQGEQRTLLTDPVVEGDDGSRLTARSAAVLERRQEMDLEGTVHVQRGPTDLRAERIHLARDAAGVLRSAAADGAVSCRGYPLAGGSADLESETLLLEWDAGGEPLRALAEGAPVLRRGAEQIEASRIEVTTRVAGSGWKVAATEGVRARGLFERAPALLLADELHAELGFDGLLVRAEVSGRVRFESSDARAESARATFLPGANGGEITLLADPDRLARLARGRSRIAARKIVTDSRGATLSAEGRVEATLLQGPKGATAPGSVALFERGDTVHFVSARMDGEPQRGHFRFQGGVRGWQGERSLSGEEVEIEQAHDSLRARTNVSSRFPRPSSGGRAARTDYVEISSDTLEYSGTSRRAAYDGNAKVRLAEGWIEGSRLEFDLDDEGKEIRELRVQGAVRFEMRAPDRSGTVPVSGKGDRLLYTPADRLLRLIGVEAPASVTRSGEQGGTTTGRVLRYRLDTGTLAVEAEDPDRTQTGPGGN